MAWAVAGGCAGSSKAPKPIDGPGEQVVVGPGAAVGGEALVGAEAWGEGGTEIFRAGGNDGGMLRLERSPTGDGGWTVQRYIRTRPEGVERLVNEQRLVAGPEGQLALAEQVDHVERVEVEFVPPMVVMPGRLESGEVQEQDLRMIVYPMGRRDRVKAQGEAKARVEYAGIEDVTGDGGAVRACVLRQVLSARLGAAQVSNTTEQWWAAGRGLVRERRSERTKVLGVLTRKQDEDWVRDAGPGR